MTVHLIKMAVGIADVPHLQRVQEARRAAARERGEPAVARHLTRNRPRRRAEVLDGGSIYWVVRGLVQVRQRIAGLDETTGEDGLPRCAILLDAALVRTEPRPVRAFQGWRYLEPADAPLDMGTGSPTDGLPAALVAELRGLGLI